MKNQETRIEIETTLKAFEEKGASGPAECYVLCLYVAGLTPRSTLAIERIRAICHRHLAGRHYLTIVDLYLQPEAARKAQVVVAPTLVKLRPAPMRMFIGDMTNEARILLGLNITPFTVH